MGKKKSSQTSSFGVSQRESHNSDHFYNSNLYASVKLNDVDEKIENSIPLDVLNNIYCHTSERMNELPDNSVHLMITSPPYNVTKEYDQNLTLESYLRLLTNVMQEVYRVLTNGGRACINIANVGRKPYIPLSDYVSKLMIEIGFNYRGEIIWDKSASAGGSCAWGSWMSASNPSLRDIHEYILVFSKGNLNRKKEGKESSISRDDFLEWTKSIWRMNTESAKRVSHPAPFPIELPHRLINLYSFKGDIVLDPFMGSGTTAIAAFQNGRSYIGYDTEEEYIKIANKRISKIKADIINDTLF